MLPATSHVRQYPDRPGTAGIATVVALFVLALWLGWDGAGAVVNADSQAYLTTGVNLSAGRGFVNAFGAQELWFPPLFPLLIGATTLGTGIDPFLAGRLIATVSSVLTVILIWRFTFLATESRAAAVAAAIVLACNSVYQELAAQSLSEPLATLFATAALTVWCRFRDVPTYREAALFGALIGAGYLTRPEVLLLLPCLAAVDLLMKPRDRSLLRKRLAAYALAAGVFALCAMPYVVYLKRHTGRFMLTNKGDVNLAMGRAGYYGLPREFIDPATLELKFASYPVDYISEVRRYGSNLLRMGESYDFILGLPMGTVIPIAALGGIVLLWRTDRRVVCGLMMQGAYLTVLARYEVVPEYLHATLPAIAVAAGTGLAGSSRRAQHGTRLLSIGMFVFCIWAAVSLAEQSSRQARWAFTQPTPNSLLRQAGLRLGANTGGTGTVMAVGGTLSYYSGLRRERLTPNDLPTIEAFAARAHAGEAVYLGVARSDWRLHPSLRALVSEPAGAPFPRVVDLSDARDRVVVFRIQ